MHITWHGQSCIRLQTRETTILIDPYPSAVGLQAPRLIADIFIFSSPENPQIEKLKSSSSFIVTAPGEYESRGVMMYGTSVDQPSGPPLMVTTIETEDMVLGHLGALATPINGPQVERLKDVDILFVPVGGKPAMTPKQATETISVIEPRIVIPVMYKIPGLTMKLEPVDVFLKELGAKSAPAEDKLRIVRKDLPEEEMRVIVLKP